MVAVMKRTPLARKTALRSRKRLNRVSARQRAANLLLDQARLEAYTRSAGQCEATELPHDCTGRAEHFHHVLPRSAGGPNTVENLLGVCEPGHSVIHGHPTMARDLGYLRSRYARRVE